jgi:hypothetical protein
MATPEYEAEARGRLLTLTEIEGLEVEHIKRFYGIEPKPQPEAGADGQV